MIIFRHTALFALIALAGCNGTTTANTSSAPSQLEFAQNLQPFQFQQEAFPSGTSFQIIEVTEGNFGVWTSNIESTGILLINVPIRLGMRLDPNLCSDGYTIREDTVSVGVSEILNWPAKFRAPTGICFKRSG